MTTVALIVGGVVSAAGAAFAASVAIDTYRMRRQRRLEQEWWLAGFEHGHGDYQQGLPGPVSPPAIPVFNPQSSRARREAVSQEAKLAAFDTGLFDGFWSAARADLTPAGISQLVKETA